MQLANQIVVRLIIASQYLTVCSSQFTEQIGYTSSLGNLMAIGISEIRLSARQGAPGMKTVKTPTPPWAVALAKELAGTEPDSVLGIKRGRLR